MDIRRFGGQYRSQELTLARTVENYATYYDIHYPNEERLAGRPLRLSPAYDASPRSARVFGEKSQWERPNWFTPNAAARRGDGRSGRAAGRASTGPRRSARRRSRPGRPPGCSTRSSFAKIEIDGPGAAAFLQRLCANDIDRPVGTIVYTQMLNRRGGIECDFTVTRLAADRFLIVTGTAFGNHDLGWIRKQPTGPTRRSAWSRPDVTSARACLGLWGPRARDILAAAHRTTCRTRRSRT